MADKERVTHDSPRTAAPPVRRPWVVRVGFVVVVLALLAIILAVVWVGVGGREDATSDPATPGEVAGPGAPAPEPAPTPMPSPE